jgi:predicted dithiol-disulfide oxidoreductase (DUF899 family)
MNLPKVVSQEQGTSRSRSSARRRRPRPGRDALAAERRRLPMVRIEADWVPEGPNGKQRLVDLLT